MSYSTSPSRLRRATARVAAPSVCFAFARILLAAAPTAPPCFRHWRRSSPLLLVGEPLACRSGSRGTREVFRIGNSSALLSRSTDANLCSKARHFMPDQTFSGQLKVSRSANGSPSGGNGDDRRQRRKQGGAVGAAASRMRAAAKQTLGAATRAVSPKVTERASHLR